MKVPYPEQRFAGKTVLVTGASSGIGEGCARRFAAEGANVVLAGRRKDKLERIAAELGASCTLVTAADVSKRAEVETMMEAALARFGQLDVLVSNAGYAIIKDFESTTLAEWRSIMETDVDSCFHCAQAALPYLKKTKGSIIHMASASGLGGDWSLSAYNAAKDAVVNFPRALAFDLGKFDIWVNAVAPSLTLSEMSEAAIADKGFVATFNQRMALKGYATPADIAGAVTFLASEDARFITGVILPILPTGATCSNCQKTLRNCQVHGQRSRLYAPCF